ncbi:hypothetical protein ACGFNU_00070 [Spirillospora sp. NPDC048911]|uniref:hypothetical protein n=1 Tax=Spirillospora sp. NPDC048911 TaxID=3364527 RepID=UPI00371F9FCE
MMAEDIAQAAALNGADGIERAKTEGVSPVGPDLKSWHVPRKARCSPSRLTSIVQAILTHHHQPE